MTWLWVLAPAIVLVGALWLVVGLRRLIAGRLDLQTESSSMSVPDDHLHALRSASDRVRRQAEQLAGDRGPDAEAAPPDR